MTSTTDLAATRRGDDARTRTIVAARVALVSGAAYAAILFVLHLTRGDVSVTWQTTSEYARGPGGWLMVLAFVLSGVSLISLAIASSAIVRSVPARIGGVVLILAGIGAALGGVFITDPIDTPQTEFTASGTVHGLAAGLALMLTPIAALILNWGLARRACSRTVRTILIVSALLPLAALMTFMIVQTLLLPADGLFGPDVPIGPAERVLVAAYATWQLATSGILIRHSFRHSARKGSRA